MSTSLPPPPLPVWVVALVAMLLAPCAARAAGPEVADDFSLLPADANMVASIQLAKVVGTDAFKKLLKEIPDLNKEFDQNFKREFGVTVDGVERLTMG